MNELFDNLAYVAKNQPTLAGWIEGTWQGGLLATYGLVEPYKGGYNLSAAGRAALKVYRCIASAHTVAHLPALRSLLHNYGQLHTSNWRDGALPELVDAYIAKKDSIEKSQTLRGCAPEHNGARVHHFSHTATTPNTL
jgi:hypothetical protein